MEILNDIRARQEKEFHLMGDEQNKQRLKITQLSNLQLSISTDSKQQYQSSQQRLAQHDADIKTIDDQL